MAEPAMPRLHRALRYAVKRHKGTDRDGDFPVPYACHPVEVMVLVRHEAGITDEDVLVAALLHDLVEDTDVQPADIEKRFGKRVRALVEEVTRRQPSEKEIAGKTPEQVWDMRNEELMLEIDRMSHEAKVIKLADRFSNVRESLRTRSGPSLDRYLRQSHQILARIPRETCPALWDAISEKLQPASAS